MSLSRPSARWLALGVACLLPTMPVFAEASTDPDVPDALEARIDALEAELQQLRAELEALRQPAPAVTPTSSASRQNAFNPDIGVNALSTLIFDSGELSDARFDFNELELSVSGVVDPFASYYASLVFLGEEVEVEEAYATLTNFPADLTTTVGRRLIPVGLWNPTHRHAWPLNNAPLVIENFLGSPHLLGTGVTTEYTWGGSTAWTASAGAYTELEGSQFVEQGLEHPLLTARVQAFVEQPEGGLQFGINALHGPVNDEGTLGSTLIGLDAKWRTGNKADLNRWLVQGEWWLNDRDGLLSDFSATGAYLLAERDVARDWTLGGRLEFAEDTFGDQSQDRWSLYANWQRSEFQRWRLQFDQTDGHDEQVSLQALFTLGPHPAHPF